MPEKATCAPLVTNAIAMRAYAQMRTRRLTIQWRLSHSNPMDPAIRYSSALVGPRLNAAAMRTRTISALKPYCFTRCRLGLRRETEAMRDRHPGEPKVFERFIRASTSAHAAKKNGTEPEGSVP